MLSWKKEKWFLFWLPISHLYCLILAWTAGGDKLNYPFQYFWYFLGWWCVWNSIVTITFFLWKWRNPKVNNYFAQVFSLITTLSNLITLVIYGVGFLIWLTTCLTTFCGITSNTRKIVPIPSHEVSEIGKVIRWWFYCPLWHLIAPSFFLVWFFRYSRTNLLKKRLKLTILFCLIQPASYYFFCLLRSKIGERSYFKEFNARWNLPFLSAKRTGEIIGIGRDYRFAWKIILVLFWFILFGLLAYYS
jgi:hypothetical protein